jgi:hypothetical protein
VKSGIEIRDACLGMTRTIEAGEIDVALSHKSFAFEHEPFISIG